LKRTSTAAPLVCLIVAGIACQGPRDHAVKPVSPENNRPTSDGGGRAQDARSDASADEAVATDGPATDTMLMDATTPADTLAPVAEVGPSGCGTPGKTCMGSTLQACGTDGALTNTPCEHGCNAVRLECNTCKPNSRTCAGSALVVCNGEGSATTMMACSSGCNTTVNECNGCMPGSRWCSGNTLRECTAGGMPMDRQTCDQGCNTTRLECNACSPGVKACNGATLQTCRPDGSGWADSPCANGCNGSRKECNACNPSSAPTCSGNNVRTCRTDGSGTTDQPCGNPSCSGQTRTVPTCRSGRCDSDSESCNGYGCSGTGCRTSCPSGTVRSGGACVPCGDSGELCCGNSCNSGSCSNGHCCPNGQTWNSGASRCEALCSDIKCSSGRCPRQTGACLALAYRPNNQNTNADDCGPADLCNPPSTSRCVGDAIRAEFIQASWNDLDLVDSFCFNRGDEFLRNGCAGNSGGGVIVWAVVFDAMGKATDSKRSFAMQCP
jgi:hypothetical protein